MVPQRKLPRGSKCTTQCWAHTRAGQRCQHAVAGAEDEGDYPIPYCHTHRSSGDLALRVVSHPWAGQLLVARFDLPKGYRMSYWGHRTRCPYLSDEDRCLGFEYRCKNGAKVGELRPSPVYSCVAPNRTVHSGARPPITV